MFDVPTPMRHRSAGGRISGWSYCSNGSLVALYAATRRSPSGVRAGKRPSDGLVRSELLNSPLTMAMLVPRSQ